MRRQVACLFAEDTRVNTQGTVMRQQAGRMRRQAASLLIESLMEGNSYRSIHGRSIHGELHHPTWILVKGEGIDYYSSARALFQTFCDRGSPALDLDEAEAIWQSASKVRCFAFHSA